MLQNIAPKRTAPAGLLVLFVPKTAVILTIIAALLLLSAGVGVRIKLWNYRTGFEILKYGAYFGLAASLAALFSIITTCKGRRFLGVALALVTLVAGVASVAVPLSWKLIAQKLPRINDITTDITNPPRFVAIIPLRKDAPNSAEYGGPAIAVKQLQAYPDIKTLILGLPKEQAFALALDTAHRMGLEIVAAVPSEGRIEATATTFWFGFKDDIVIRITPVGDRSLIDVRSASRVGISDVGTNARRIRAYLNKIEGKK